MQRIRIKHVFCEVAPMLKHMFALSLRQMRLRRNEGAKIFIYLLDSMNYNALR